MLQIHAQPASRFAAYISQQAILAGQYINPNKFKSMFNATITNIFELAATLLQLELFVFWKLIFRMNMVLLNQL